MCIILLTKAGAKAIDKTEFDRLSAAYGSSYGVMWPDKEAGKVRREVAETRSNAGAKRVYDAYVAANAKGLPAVLHFRSGTGPAVQPCLNKDETIGLAVNGTIGHGISPEYGSKTPVPRSLDQDSDTYYCAREILSHYDTKTILNPIVAGHLAAGGCHAVFMTAEGYVIIEGTRAATEEFDGTWYSIKQWRPNYDEFNGYYDAAGYYQHGPNYTGTRRAGITVGNRDRYGNIVTPDDPSLIAKMMQRMLEEVKKERDELMRLRASTMTDPTPVGETVAPETGTPKRRSVRKKSPVETV